MSSSSSSSFSSSSGGKRALERLAATVLDHDAWTFASTRARDAARRREVSAAVAECARLHQLCSCASLDDAANAELVLRVAATCMARRLLGRIGRTLDDGVRAAVDAAVADVATRTRPRLARSRSLDDDDDDDDDALARVVETRMTALAEEMIEGWKGADAPRRTATATATATAIARAVDEVRSIHWSPCDPNGVVNADP
jgi:hypothetical protein